MIEDVPPQDFAIAIIGGGAGGVITALQALRLATAGTRIVIIEPAPRLAEGVAYATRHAEHLLNVPARRMSAFNDRPDDFVDFLIAGDESTRAAVGIAYAQRRHYGDYLRERLQQARDATAAHFEVRQDRVTAIEPRAGAWQLTLQSGALLQARGIVLAVGNNAKPLPVRGATSLPAGRVLEAWDFDNIKRIPTEAEVCIAGSGLSMVDTVLSLVANGHRGRVHVLSRHALLPLPHTTHSVATLETEFLQRLSLRARMRFLRRAVEKAQAEGLPWQAVMEAVRPSVQLLWSTLCLRDQKRFLRHVVRYWDVHRHRIAAQVHAQLEQLQATGQLQLHRARLDTVALEGNRLRINGLTRDRRALQLDVDCIVNATGVEMRAQLMHSPVLSDLLGQGLARPGPHGIGIDTTPDGQLVDGNGEVRPDFLVIGSLRIGRLWESIAVPELRGQAESAARQLLENR